MAKSRRAQRRERRTYKKWLRNEELKKLRRTEDAILEKDRPSSYRSKITWEVADAPELTVGDAVLGVDFGKSGDETVVITGSKDADGTFVIRPSAPGKYRIIARINET